jgi:hypothetical protein
MGMSTSILKPHLLPIMAPRANVSRHYALRSSSQSAVDSQVPLFRDKRRQPEISCSLPTDIFGRRYFMITGALISFVGTIVGATAHSINQMIVSGVLFGIGSGFQEMGYAACQEIVPNKYRMWAIGVFDVMGIIAQSGPIVAYSFIANASIGWRGAYYYSELTLQI